MTEGRPPRNPRYNVGVNGSPYRVAASVRPVAPEAPVIVEQPEDELVEAWGADQEPHVWEEDQRQPLFSVEVRWLLGFSIGLVAIGALMLLVHR